MDEGSADELSTCIEDLSPPPAFILRKGSPAHFQSAMEDEKPIPFCRDTPFRTLLVHTDINMQMAHENGGWCKACISRMPRPLSEVVVLLARGEEEGGARSAPL